MATAADSVAVKIPKRMPPRIITGVPSARMARLKFCHIWSIEKRVAAPYPFFQEINVPTPMSEMPINTPGKIPPAKRIKSDRIKISAVMVSSLYFTQQKGNAVKHENEAA